MEWFSTINTSRSSKFNALYFLNKFKMLPMYLCITILRPDTDVENDRFHSGLYPTIDTSEAKFLVLITSQWVTATAHCPRCNSTRLMQLHRACQPGPRRFSAVEKVTVSRPRSGGLAGSRAICFAAAISTTPRETNDRALGCGTTGYEKRVGTGVSGGSKKKKRGREKKEGKRNPISCAGLRARPAELRMTR